VTATRLPTAGEIADARARVAGVAARTPLVPVATDAGEVLLKLETAQPIRSFKIRGAASCLRAVPRESLARGVWTASAGNMAQGAAWVARELGVPCRVVVPEQAPRAKTDAVEALGAAIVRVPFDAWWAAMASRSHPGMAGFFVHPFADPFVMAGNGTIGIELAEDAPDLDAVLVPWGGGGLALGIATALRSVSPGTRVYAVEVETAAPLTASLAAGKPVAVMRTPTFIDGMGADRVSDATWPHVRDLIAGTVVVTVAQVVEAVRRIHAACGVVAEGAGAAALAAAIGGRLNGVGGARLDARRVACIVSGGNLDPMVLSTILAGGTP
jgi:threonine dehydratase